MVNLYLLGIVAIAAGILPHPAHAQSGIPRSAENCALFAPPDNAGEEMVHASMLRIFPRARDFPARYTGCQTTWFVAGKRWEILGVTYFTNGAAALFWNPGEKHSAGVSCRYAQSVLIEGPPTACPAYFVLPAKSLPAGCIAKRKSDRTLPPECRYE